MHVRVAATRFAQENSSILLDTHILREQARDEVSPFEARSCSIFFLIVVFISSPTGRMSEIGKTLQVTGPSDKW
jgi:hypothetical protein